MDFDTVIAGLTYRLTQPLPGPMAHDQMRAKPAGAFRPKFEHHVPPKPGSVLILLYPDGNRIKFPLTQRADYQGTHGGQISLPGGKAELGESHVDTALRECEEEIGVSRDTIKVIGRLSDFFVIPSNFIVIPVVGISSSKPLFKADPVEVVKILEGDIADLMGDDAIQEREILAAKLYPMLAPHFEIGGEVVWGATAMMLNELRTILREIV